MVFRRSLRVKWTDKRSNKSVLEEIGSPKQMLETIRKRKLKYVGHACRHTNSQLMLNTLQGKTQSARRKGRPTTSPRVLAQSYKRLHREVRTEVSGHRWLRAHR